TSDRGLSDYVPYHIAGALASTLIAITWVYLYLSPSRAKFNVSRRDVSEGASFAAMRFTDAAQASLDKIFVLMLGGSHAAGIYTAAYRLVSVATIPLVSLSMSALPRLFREGNGIGKGTSPLAKGILLVTFIYGVIAAFAILITSGLL